MKVIFLDVDGVLNCRKRWDSLPLANPSHRGTRIDPAAVARVKAIMDRTGAKIVVSSTWRICHSVALVMFLDKCGIDRSRIVGWTPHLGDYRGVEIQGWLDQNPDVTEFVILDDGSDMGELIDRLIKTTWDRGLLDEHVERAVEMLSVPHGAKA